MKLSPEQRRALTQQREQLPAELPEGSYAIYTLTDPQSEMVRYVGITRQPYRRLLLHLKKVLNTPSRRSWLTELAAKDQVPVMTVVEIFNGTKGEAARTARQGNNRLCRVDDDSSSESPTVNIAVDQYIVPFHGQPLHVARLADGRVCIMLRELCEVLRIHLGGQIQRIRRKTALRDGLVYVRVATDGGP